MNKLRALIANRDASMVRTLVLVALVIAGASVLFLITGRALVDGNGTVAGMFKAAAASPWAFPIVALAFTALSFVAAPQFLLIALSVAAFGPLRGFAFAYAATLISASVNFLFARYVGAAWLRERQPGTLKTISEFVGRNGFFSAMIVRIVPSAPFVVVNMGLGLTTTPYIAFIAGTAIGILPKTTLVALLGKVLEQARTGDASAIAYLVAAAIAWIALALAARWLVNRRGRR
ncbi:MAG: TVP38/TMEM64 family protein [Hyphomicrobiaceae bacterium]|nr:TVP38/TMEM64 family protein [Hyphomicrobiaceae bacterium]